ncbi:MAG: DUF4375 domain-containing protein [Gemmataceae bacterium]
MSPEEAEQHLLTWLATIPKSEVSILPELERTLWLVYALEMEVSNGGVHQYFANPAGDNWKETLVALQRIGASRIEQLLTKALTVFPHHSPSVHHLTRAVQLRAIDSEAEAFLEQLTDNYYSLHLECPEQDAYRVMSNYLLQEQGKQTQPHA